VIELVFIACVAKQPETCEEHSFQFVDITPMTCVMGAQPALAQWGTLNPQYVIKSWKCQNTSQREVRA